MSDRVVALAAGLLFSVGLAISGMTRPSKVLGFLDVTGAWDPSLMFVMLGAIGVYASAYWASRRMQKPIAGAAFAQLPPPRVDARLVGGAATFGVGWGLSGLCPGPAVTSIGAGTTSALLFVPAMLAGMWLARRFTNTA
jgi:uncharacterized membrane protein YedE/YeeE